MFLEVTLTIQEGKNSPKTRIIYLSATLICPVTGQIHRLLQTLNILKAVDHDKAAT